MFKLIGSFQNRYNSCTISFDRLIDKIKTQNDWVNKARSIDKYKNPDGYRQFKIKNIESFHPNNLDNSSTGYIFLDIDKFQTTAEAIAYKAELINKHSDLISACWLSLSTYGLGLLVKVNGLTQTNYDQYWNELNILFENGLDNNAKGYNKLSCISYDKEVYVNTTSKEYTLLNKHISNDSNSKEGGAVPVILNTQIITPTAPPLSLNSVYWQTQIEDSEFENVNTPKVYPEGKQILKIDLYQYRNNKIPIGKRNCTMGAISMQLIMINQYAVTRQQLLNALLSINSRYTVEPLTKDEIIKIFNANYKRFDKKELDIRPYLKTKYVFFHRECQIPSNERIRIAVNAFNKIRGRGKEYKESLIYEAIENLQDGITPITRERLMEFTRLKVDCIKRYWKPFKSVVDSYNESLKPKIEITEPVPDEEYFNLPV